MNDNSPPAPTDADLKAALLGLIALQEVVVRTLKEGVAQMEKIGKGVTMLSSELERRSTINPERPN